MLEYKQSKLTNIDGTASDKPWYKRGFLGSVINWAQSTFKGIVGYSIGFLKSIHAIGMAREAREEMEVVNNEPSTCEKVVTDNPPTYNKASGLPTYEEAKALAASCKESTQGQQPIGSVDGTRIEHSPNQSQPKEDSIFLG